MAAQVDHYGTSFYPKHSAFVDRDVEWRGALLDFARSFGFARGGRGFWIGELQGGLRHDRAQRHADRHPGGPAHLDLERPRAGGEGHLHLRLLPDEHRLRVRGLRARSSSTGRSPSARAWPGRSRAGWGSAPALFLAARPPQSEVAVVYNPLAHFVGGRQRATAYAGPAGRGGGHRARLAPRDLPGAVPDQRAARLRPRRPPEGGRASALQAGGAALPADDAGRGRRRAARLRAARAAASSSEARAGWNDERGRAAETIPGLGLFEVVGRAGDRRADGGEGQGGARRGRGPAGPEEGRGAARPLVRGDARARLSRRARRGPLRERGAGRGRVVVRGREGAHARLVRQRRLRQPAVGDRAAVLRGPPRLGRRSQAGRGVGRPRRGAAARVRRRAPGLRLQPRGDAGRGLGDAAPAPGGPTSSRRSRGGGGRGQSRLPRASCGAAASPRATCACCAFTDRSQV